MLLLSWRQCWWYGKIKHFYISVMKIIKECKGYCWCISNMCCCYFSCNCRIRSSSLRSNCQVLVNKKWLPDLDSQSSLYVGLATVNHSALDNMTNIAFAICPYVSSLNLYAIIYTVHANILTSHANLLEWALCQGQLGYVWRAPVAIWHHDQRVACYVCVFSTSETIYKHCSDVIMGMMASQITSLTIVYSTV